MISSILIEGYRGFERFEMTNLGRINLLVGTNNSGKTSVLEAVHLLTSGGDPLAVWQTLWRRGERVTVPNPAIERSARGYQIETDICHLFTGHELHTGSRFILSAKNQAPERYLMFGIVEMSGKDRTELFGPEDDGALSSRLALEIKGIPSPPVPMIPLSRLGGVVSDVMESPRRRRGRATDPYPPQQFITTDSLAIDRLLSLWDKISLKPEENLVLTALRFLDGNIERIAPQSVQPMFGVQSRGGFIVKLKNVDQPIPIGSMGDGMWRLLAMAIAITQCTGGVLLVDEIDTGLHYTVMSKMWRLIFNAAKEFNVQVFATTHSYDCVYSLAQICSEADEHNQVSVQRIEPGKIRAIQYGEDEIKVAADREIEVR